MRNKKSLLGLGLLALVLVLGVGYAAISGQVLTIGGTVTTAEETIAVYFKEALAATNLSEGVTATGAIGAGEKTLTANLTVTGLDEIGDSATLTYVVANDEKDLAAELLKKEIKVESDAKADLSTFYTVTTSVDTQKTTVEKATGDTPGTANVTVTVTLAKLPITTDESKANITITLDATPVQPA